MPAAAPALGPLRSAVTAPLVVEPPPCSSPRPVGGVGCGVVSGRARVGRSPPLGLEPITPVGAGAAEADERGAVTKKSAGVGVMAVTGPLEDVPMRPLGRADPPRAGAAVAAGDGDVVEADVLVSSSESESEGFPDSTPSESEADVISSSSAAPSVDEGRPAAAPVPGGVAARLDGGRTTTPSPDPTPEPRDTVLVATGTAARDEAARDDVATGTAARDEAARDDVALDGVAMGGAANPAPVPPVPAPTDAPPAPGSPASEGVWTAAGAGRVERDGMSSSESSPLSKPSSPDASSPEWSSPEWPSWLSSRLLSDLRVTLLRAVVLGWGKSSLSEPSVSKPSVSVSSPRWAYRRASHRRLLSFWA